MNDELIKELSRLQLLSSRCKNKMSMCPLSITLEESRAYLIFNYIKELQEEKQEWINLLDMFKNQQKEFIEYLKNEIYSIEPKGTGINYNCEYDSEEDYISAMQEQSRLNTLKEILQKYKEIIGVSDEKR